MATGARGEAIITLADREVSILFTNRALADVEQKLGRSIINVGQALGEGTAGITEMVTLLRAGMDAARRDSAQPGPPVALNSAFDVMDEAGFGPVAIAVMEAVAVVLGWGVTESGSTEAADPNV